MIACIYGDEGQLRKKIQEKQINYFIQRAQNRRNTVTISKRRTEGKSNINSVGMLSVFLQKILFFFRLFSTVDVLEYERVN